MSSLSASVASIRLAHHRRGFVPAEVFQHQHAGQQHGAGLAMFLPVYFGGGAVGGLEHGRPVADVRPGGEAEAAGQGRGRVGQVVAV